MPTLGLIEGNETTVLRMTQALYGVAPGYSYFNYFMTNVQANGASGFAGALTNAFSSVSDSSLATTVLANLGLTTAGGAALQDALTTLFTTYGTAARGQIILNLANLLAAKTGDATYGAAADAFNAQISTGYTYSTVAANTTPVAVSSSTGQTFTLTTGIDTTITGASGADTITGMVNYSGGALAATTTYNSGDIIKGSTGTDTFDLTISGSDVAADTLTPTLQGIETMSVMNYETEAGQSLTVDLSLADSSLATVGTAASTNVDADTTFTNIGKAVALVMAGKGDMTVSYNASVMTGASDAATVTLNGVGTSATTISALDVSSIEALSLVSATSANYVSVANRSVTSVAVSGSQNINVDVLDTDVTSFDASAATGVVTADLDAITLSNLTTIKGGAGTSDVLQIDEAVTVTGSTSATNTLNAVSGFETVKVVGNAVAVALTTNGSGVTKFSFDDGAATVQQTLTLNTGYDQAITVTIDDTDDVTNSANVALTVNVNSDDLLAGNAIAGGTGTDTINVTAKAGTSVLTNVSGVETINILAGTAGTEDVTMNVGAANGTVASTKTLAINASALTNSGARLEFTGTGETDGYFSVTGGAGNDAIVGGSAADTISGGAHNDTIDGAAGNDVIDGGAGNDSITAGAGNDSILGGDGNDTFELAGNLTTNDTIDGGSGTDTLKVTSISGAALTNVTNVESLSLSGASSSATLTANLSFTTIDMSTADDTAQTLTLSTGYTNATSVSVDAGDAVLNSANVALTVTAAAAGITSATTITGGTGTDSMTLTADNGTANFSNVTAVDAVTVADSTVSGDDVTFTLGSYATAMSINASALNGSDERLIVSGGSATKNLSVTGGAGNDAITGGSGNDSVVGGAHNDTITGAAGNDNFSGDAGDDLFDIGNNELTYQDTIAGGDGNDTIEVNATTAVSDVAFMNVTSVKTLTITDANAGVTLATYAAAAGIDTVNTLTGVDNVVTATGMTTGVTFVVAADAGNGGVGDSVTGGIGNDVFEFSGTTRLDAADKLEGTSGTDTVRLDNSAAAFTGEIDLDNATNIDQIVVKDDDGGNSGTAQAVALTVSALSLTTAQTVVVTAAAITDSNDTFTLTNNAGTSTHGAKFSVTGGAGNDTLAGSYLADTIVGGSGDDLITGNVGADSLSGGAGNDTFAFASGDGTPAAVDTITDFAAAGDKLKVTLTLAAAGIIDMTDKGDAASNADGLSLLSGSSGTTRIGQYFFNTGSSQLVMDVDGNGLIQATDLVVALTGNTGIADTDVRGVLTGANGGANTITGGGGDDVITGGDNTDTLTGGAGNDYITGNTGNDIDSLVGGTGNDTHVIADVGAADVFIEAASGGTNDSLLVAGLDASAINVNGAAGGVLNGASGLGFEQVVLGNGGTTFIGAQLTALTLNLTEINGGSTGTLAVTATGGGTTNLASMTFTAGTYVDSSGNVVAGSAFDGTITITGAGTDETVVGTSRADSIVGAAGADTLTGGNGADTITAGDGIDAIVLTETTSAADVVNLTGVTTAANRDTVTGFVSATDKIWLDLDYTTVATATTVAAVVQAVADVTEVVGGDFGLTAIANTNSKDLYILAGGNEVSADLSAATNGDELLKYLGTAGNAATGITVGTTGDKFFIAAYDAGNTYIYQVTEAATGVANTQAVTADIALVGVLSGTATVVAGDFVMIA